MKTVAKAKAKPTGKSKASNGKAQEPKPKERGLRKPQVRILALLGKSKQPLDRKAISEKAPCDLPMCNSYLGSEDAAIRAKCDKHFPTLLTLGYVKSEAVEGLRGVAYSITASGKAALEKAKVNNG